jgi:hypothetical protein
MARPPVAREKILSAARQIVERDGAGALTLTNSPGKAAYPGGITYHYPPRRTCCGAPGSRFPEVGRFRGGPHPDRLRAGDGAPPGIHPTLTAQDESHRRFLCGMLSAATLDPSLMDPCRQELRERLGRKQWTERDLRLHLVHLAAEG